MELTLGWDQMADVVGAAAMVAFGGWLLTLTPRTRTTKLLATFAMGAGTAFIVNNLFAYTGWHVFAVWWPLFGAGMAIGGVALLGLMHEQLPAGEPGARRMRWLAWVVPTGLIGFPIAVDAFQEFPVLTFFEGWQLASLIVYYAGLMLLFSAFLALLLVLAHRYRDPPPGKEDTLRTQGYLVSAALVIWPAYWAGWATSSLVAPNVLWWLIAVFDVLLFAGFLALAGLWLYNARAVPHRSHEGRNLALLTLGMVLAGMLQRLYLDPLFPDDGPIWGVLRLVSVVGLAYGILRHEVLGIETKLQWGVSKTTVAGIFIAVFFIVSEGAQALFADFAGNELLGVLAAGALVFFISPLQRLADGVATKAIPGADPQAASPEREYRRAVEATLADGEVSPGEELHLAELADELGLATKRAYEIRREVEGDVVEGPGGDPA